MQWTLLKHIHGAWWGIANALTKAGVPDKYADMIADFIVKYIL